MSSLHLLLRYALSVCSVLLCLGCLGCTHQQAARVSKSQKRSPIFLWKASHPQAPKASLYLYGTIHVGKEQKAGVDIAVKEALDRSELLALESVPADRSTKKTALATAKMEQERRIVQQHGLLSGRQQLHKVISPKTYRLLTKVSRKFGMSPRFFHKMKPWLVSMALSSIQMGYADVRREFGKESILMTYAEKNKQRLVSLERLSDQLQVFSKMSPKQQEAYLVSTLMGLDGHDDTFKILDIYKTGNMDLLEKYLNQSNLEQFRDLRRRIGDDRNVLMVKRIKELVAQSKKAFVAVGVAHYVGKTGILALLKSSGYTIQRVPAKGLLPFQQPFDRYQHPDKYWIHVKDRRHRVSIKFPVKPRKLEKKISTPNGIHLHTLYTAERAIFHTAMSITEYPPRVRQLLHYTTNRARLYNHVVRGWLHRTKGKLVTFQKVRLFGSIAFFVQVKTHSTFQEGFLTLRNGRMIQIAVIHIGKLLPKDPRRSWRKVFFRSLSMERSRSFGITL